MKSCPKTFLSTLSFYEKDAVAGISVVFVRALNLHVAAADAVTKHMSLSTLAPFSCALFKFFFCNHTARALLRPLPPSRDCSWNASPGPTMWSVPALQTSPAFASLRAELYFVGLKPFRPIRVFQGTGCRIGTVVSRTTVVGTVLGQWSWEKWASPGEPIAVWPG